ncbi:SemiSWEET transporter [Gramella sp. AN32]|uniref:SemiSWEET family sugar transporter n=1 Tax=Christiangramia antarctica TaxID=2058158 RepID=A0ABW5X7L4_9FLAO|nr:SemiSWEET transporter [Gramella sp. AN32]MCM4155528.1 hypothetical protein [Gramella sp. AN32]
MNWEVVLGIVAGICTTVAVIPQIIKAWKSKKVKDVSPGMFIILMIGVALWVVYGVVKNDIPIIATNGVSLALNSVMFYLMMKYKKD